MRRAITLATARRAITLATAAGLAALTACTSAPSPPAGTQAATGLVRMDADGVARPDPALSPGSSASGASATDVCSPTYPRSVALASDTERRDTFARYGLPYPAAQTQYRIDHVIPVELGGDNSPANLWPEPVAASTADRKNAVGNRLHELVCNSSLPLATAQQAMASDWYAAWKANLAPASATPAPTPPTTAGPTTPPSTSESAVPSRRPSTARPTPTPSPTRTTQPPAVPAPPPQPAPAAPAPPAPAPGPPAPPVPATSTPAQPTTSPTQAADRAVRGQSCAPIGATAVGPSGARLVCTRVNNSGNGRWRPAG